ncbi:MAG TPA: hypothetical protein DDW65_00125 [Firmicutes bacterium]|jgi:outer membrane receptor protein involved in Fe transport|nr:hypothetical protein [Bacillota bacterium]
MIELYKTKSVRLGIMIYCLLVILATVISADTPTTSSPKGVATQNKSGENQEPDSSGDGDVSSGKDSKEETAQTSDVPVTEVEVQGEKGGSAQVGPLGDQSLQDTPYSINVTSSEEIENTQADTVTEALKYNPSVQSATGCSRAAEYFMIRSFESTMNSTAIDGAHTSMLNPVEDKESIEVMNGQWAKRLFVRHLWSGGRNQLCVETSRGCSTG